MLDRQAVKGLEETCHTFVFKSLPGKGRSELNAIVGSNRFSAWRD